MKKIYSSLILIIFLSTNIYSQDEFCSKEFDTKSYFPLNNKLRKSISWYNSIYKEYVNGTIKINGTEYIKYMQDFSESWKIELLLRKSGDTIFSYYGGKDNIMLIDRPEVGIKWDKAKISSISGVFETPYCKYKNLLVIEYSYKSGKTKRYYKKGLGLVGIENENKVIGMCLPSKEETEDYFRPVSFKGCENLKNSKIISECTMNSIYKIVNKRISKGGFKPPKESGIYKFDIVVSNKGKIEFVTTINSLKRGNQLKNIIIEELESLPDFIPVTLFKTITHKARLKISIPVKVN